MNTVISSLFAVICARHLAHPPSMRMHLYGLIGLYSFAELLLQCLHVLPFLSFFCCLLSTICFATFRARGLAHGGAEKTIPFAEQIHY